MKPIQIEQNVDEAEREFAEVSKTIRGEYERYLSERKTDLAAILSQYINGLLDTQYALLEQWEKFAPEAHAIAISQFTLYCMVQTLLVLIQSLDEYV